MASIINTSLEYPQPNSGAPRSSQSDVQSPTSTVVASPTSPRDVELDAASDDVKRPVPGWPLLANIMAEKPDLESFPSFMDLNIKSLLYYQAELVLLRRKLHEAEYADYRKTNTDEPASRFATDLQFLFEACDDNPKELPEQWKIMEKIRLVLEKYNNTLLQISRITALPGANSCNITSLREIIKHINRTGSLTGSGSQTWGDLCTASDPPPTFGKLCLNLITGIFKPYPERTEVENEFQEHLILPCERRKQDGLTLWVIHSFVPLYHYMWKNWFMPLRDKVSVAYHRFNCNLCQCGLPNCFKSEKRRKRESAFSQDSKPSHHSPGSLPSSPSGDYNLTEYDGAWIVRATSIMTTVVACLLPTIAITVLARVHGMPMILGLIALFTAVFAFGLVLLSSTSSRVEIFTATAAFSAVMVVFVQNQIGPN